MTLKYLAVCVGHSDFQLLMGHIRPLSLALFAKIDLCQGKMICLRVGDWITESLEDLVYSQKDAESFPM